MPFGFVFKIFPFIFFIIFFIIIVAFITIFIKGFSEWNNNNHSPKLTIDAKVVSKRMNTMRNTYNSRYYATFEFEGGERLELFIPPTDFGYIVEGDKGKLTFKGTRFIKFEREI